MFARNSGILVGKFTGTPRFPLSRIGSYLDCGLGAHESRAVLVRSGHAGPEDRYWFAAHSGSNSKKERSPRNRRDVRRPYFLRCIGSWAVDMIRLYKG